MGCEAQNALTFSHSRDPRRDSRVLDQKTTYCDQFHPKPLQNRQTGHGHNQNRTRNITTSFNYQGDYCPAHENWQKFPIENFLCILISWVSHPRPQHKGSPHIGGRPCFPKDELRRRQTSHANDRDGTPHNRGGTATNAQKRRVTLRTPAGLKRPSKVTPDQTTRRCQVRISETATTPESRTGRAEKGKKKGKKKGNNSPTTSRDDERRSPVPSQEVPCRNPTPRHPLRQDVAIRPHGIIGSRIVGPTIAIQWKTPWHHREPDSQPYNQNPMEDPVASARAG